MGEVDGLPVADSGMKLAFWNFPVCDGGSAAVIDAITCRKAQSIHPKTWIKSFVMICERSMRTVHLYTVIESSMMICESVMKPTHLYMVIESFMMICKR